MSLQETVLIAGMASTLIPVIAIFLRDRSAYMTVPSLITAVAVAVHLAVVLRFVQIGQGPPEILSRILMGSMFASLAGGYVLSVSFGRENPGSSLRQSRRTFGILGLIGLVLLAFAGSRSFIEGYAWEHGRGAILIGWLGKAYLTYALIAVILIGYNLEKTYRIAAPEFRRQLKLPMLATFAALFYGTFVLTMGMLYSSLGTGKFVAAALPIGIVNVVIGYGYSKGSLSDVAAPVSRTIVYSSFTAITAGLFVAAVGLAGQLAGWTRSSPDEILVLAFGILVILSAALLLLSNRFQRQVRRFIDRNFYVNRYDYRTQWQAVAAAFVSASGREDVLKGAMKVLEDVFLTDEITISLIDRSSGMIQPVCGKGASAEGIVLSDGSPLHLMLGEGRKALLIDRRSHDFTFIPVYAENADWLDRTASEMIAPLCDSERLVGTIGLGRSRPDDPFTYEDVSLLGSMAEHVAAAIRSAELSMELVETREVELMSNLSSMILHDLKNYVSPLRLAAFNLDRSKNDPEAVSTCAEDVRNVADRMTTLIRMLSDLRECSNLSTESLDVNGLVREGLDMACLGSRPDVELEFQLEAKRSVLCDRGMLRRVLENLVCNAVEAMPEGGRLSLRTEDTDRHGSPAVMVNVEDTGVGMTREFLRDDLFRPFVTTKTKGLGLGLYQCRSILRLHGGELTAQSKVGEGTTFTAFLPSEVGTRARQTVMVVATPAATREIADEPV